MSRIKTWWETSDTATVLTILATVGLGAAFWALVAWMLIWNTKDLIEWVNEPADYRADCVENAVENSMLIACWSNTQCNLNNHEINRMYTSNKKMIMACAAANVSRAIQEAAPAKDGQTPQEPEPEKEDMRAGI